MLNIPLNHKTIFLFDHTSHFNIPCGHTYDFDVINKAKPNSNATTISQIKPLGK
jgi:hypothetical protein